MQRAYPAPGLPLAGKQHAQHHGQHQAGQPDGPGTQRLADQRTDPRAHHKGQDDAIVVEHVGQQGLVAGAAVLHQQLGAAAQVAGTHGGGVGPAMHPPEGLHLQRAHKGHAHVGQIVPALGRGQKAHRRQHRQLDQQHPLPPVEPPAGARLAPRPDPFRQQHAGHKGQDGQQIVPRTGPVAPSHIHAQHHDIARLGVGKHVPPSQIGVCIQKAACQCQQKAHTQRLAALHYGLLFVLHRIFPPACNPSPLIIVPSPAKCNLPKKVREHLWVLPKQEESVISRCAAAASGCSCRPWGRGYGGTAPPGPPPPRGPGP